MKSQMEFHGETGDLGTIPNKKETSSWSDVKQCVLFTYESFINFSSG